MRILLLKISLLLWCFTVEADEIKAITYNVWFDYSTSDQRVPRLLDLVAEKNADIIAFQEVERWFVNALEADVRFKYYHFSVERGWFNSIKGGLLILTKNKNIQHKYIHLPSDMDRGLLYVKTEVFGVQLCIATVHLESMLDDTKLRIAQLDALSKETSNCNNMILLGDFNFGDNDFENRVVNSDYLDVWKQLNPNYQGYTWNIIESNLAKRNSFPSEGSRRLDKVYIKGNLLIPKGIEMIGNHSFITQYGQILFPSDHFGLLTRFYVKNE